MMCEVLPPAFPDGGEHAGGTSLVLPRRENFCIVAVSLHALEELPTQA